VYKNVWYVVKVIQSFCGVTLSQYFILCHTVLKFFRSVMMLIHHADCSVVCCSVCQGLWMFTVATDTGSVLILSLKRSRIPHYIPKFTVLFLL